MFTRWRSIAAAVAVTALVVGPANASLAQDDSQGGCTGDVIGLWPNAGFGNNATASIYAVREGRPSQRTIAAAVPAGTYQVMAVSYDGYTDRTYTTPAQDFEQYFLEFLGSDGGVLATTGPTVDLESGVEEASWAGPVGQVTLAADATAVRATHLFAGQPIGTHSVMPSCFGATAVVIETTTTTTTTTTTIEPPVITTDPPSSTTSPPPFDTTTTTSTVPTEVLPEVQQNPDPDPVVGTPSFTG